MSSKTPESESLKDVRKRSELFLRVELQAHIKEIIALKKQAEHDTRKLYKKHLDTLYENENKRNILGAKSHTQECRH